MSKDVRIVARRIIDEVINHGDMAAFDELVASEWTASSSNDGT